MILKDVVFEDLVNYRVATMFLIFNKCSFKCEKECNGAFCQNSSIVKMEDREVSIDYLIDEYLTNPITHGITCGGLEPFDSWEDLKAFIDKIRIYTADPIVIYTGYKEEEITDKIEVLSRYENIIVKFGRYVPNKEPHFDKLLGVKLASPNQYAKVVSKV